MAGDPKERRRAERHDSGLRTVCQLAEEGAEPMPATVRDISRTGVGLLVPSPVPPGSLLRVHLPSGSQQDTVVLAYVAHASRQPGGGWRVGAGFSTELGDDDIRLALAGRGPSGEDRRSREREPARAKARFRQIPDPNGRPPLFADVLNISTAGIGLLLPLQLDPGTMLELDLLKEGGANVMTVLACVVYLRPRDDGWVAGCSLIHEIPESVCGQLS